jgi:hypothetical protein
VSNNWCDEFIRQSQTEIFVLFKEEKKNGLMTQQQQPAIGWIHLTQLSECAAGCFAHLHNKFLYNVDYVYMTRSSISNAKKIKEFLTSSALIPLMYEEICSQSKSKGPLAQLKPILTVFFSR